MNLVPLGLYRGGIRDGCIWMTIIQGFNEHPDQSSKSPTLNAIKNISICLK